MDGYSASPSVNLAQQYQALLEVNDVIAVHHDLAELFRDLVQRLPRVIKCSSIAMALHNPDRNTMRMYILEHLEPGPLAPGVEYPVEDVPAGWVWQHQKPFVCNSVEQETRFPKVMPMVRQAGIRSFCGAPLTTARRRLGGMAVGSREEHCYQSEEIEFLKQVAKQVAVAVENVLNFESARAAEQRFMRERDRLRLLVDVANHLSSNLQLPHLLHEAAASVRRVMQCDIVTVHLPNEAGTHLQAYALDFPDGRWILQDAVWEPMEGTLHGKVFQTGKPVVAARIDPAEYPEEAAFLATENIIGGCIVPMLHRGRVLGNLGLGRKTEVMYTEEEVDFLTQFGTQLAIAIDNAKAYGQIADSKDKLAQEKHYLEDEIRTEQNFEEIIGDSAALKRVLKQIEIVAPTDSTVLVLGETGTGKELVARAIHERSRRRERTFVKLNCAAIPTGLLESELFGHERGAFTGAIATKVGRFELADEGTLFLDEVGDIPLELQSKLLRVLQEQEFERLGSTKTIKVNIRLIAATNRDLPEMVEDKLFRSDLYYRLNVFPILNPSLRDRPGDIPLLVRYFTQRYSRRMERRIERIPTEAMEVLSRYHWPGNIRELENFVQRAVILSQGTELQIPVAELKIASPKGAAQSVATLEAAERHHILQALQQADWVIAGPSGAAALLGMKRSTLQSKMTKLGISRRS